MIPNNIDLDSKHTLRKQLELYQIRFKNWWKQSGPYEFLDMPMKIRCPKEVGSKNWAEYKTVVPSAYEWGIFTLPRNQNRILFGAFENQKVWKDVPSDYFQLLLEHIVTQADAENGAVEQVRILTQTAPSLHDLNNFFQFSLEEGRHSWAMVHILLEYFGHDGMIEANKLLERMSGNEESPRILDAFNTSISDWLSHFLWCFLSDRAGKYQLSAVTDGAFTPLAESARFMMCEEPLHITFGMLGLERILCKSQEVTLKNDCYDIFEFGAIPLPVIQKYLNYWAPQVYDLFGHDESKRAQLMFEIGIRSPNRFDQYKDREIKVDRCNEGLFESVFVNSEQAINCIMRQQFIAEVQRILDSWNKKLQQKGIDFLLKLPHERFNRKIGPCKGANFDIDGNLFLGEDYQTYWVEQLPSIGDFMEVNALMKQTLDLDKYASWIAPASARLT